MLRVKKLNIQKKKINLMLANGVKLDQKNS